MACSCIKKCNEQLEKQGSNTRIDSPIMVNFNTGKSVAPKCMIAARKVGNGKKRMTSLICAYCPICGKKYE